MPRIVGIGHQDFEQMITSDNFYIDKTMFIKEWWENNDTVTLITRPRRFGKTLNLSMTEHFFSVKHSGRDDLFQNLSIWQEEKYRELQGTYPVIFLSFAGVKETSFPDARKSICQIIENLYNKYDFLLESDHLNEREKKRTRTSPPIWIIIWPPIPWIPYRITWCVIMGKRWFSYWTNMILLCRKPMCMATGMNWFLLSAICFIPLLRQILSLQEPSWPESPESARSQSFLNMLPIPQELITCTHISAFPLLTWIIWR